METGFKGTKGEWAMTDADHCNERDFPIEIYGESYPIAEVNQNIDQTDDEWIANAQLIAAAPIMLDALVRIKAELLRCDMLDERTEKFINATVAKATGGQS